MYDSNRKMQVLTAYGLTQELIPEYGALGQGAVESPMGWLAFMCWMSEYVEKCHQNHTDIITKDNLPR